jgi:tRNA(Ile)-lysidine synthetase-like protein
LQDGLDFVKEFFELSIQQQQLLADSKPRLLLEWERWVETDLENNTFWIPETIGNQRWLEEIEMRNFAIDRLQNWGFTQDQIGKILNFSVQIGGKIIGKNYIAYRIRSGWRLFKELPKFKDGILKIARVTQDEFVQWKSENIVETATNTVFVSQLVQGMNLRVGSRKTGDFFIGVSGKKKLLSDLFIDLKIENYLKDMYPVISNDMGEVIAVLGLKIGEKYRVKMEDSYCFRLDFIQN